MMCKGLSVSKDCVFLRLEEKAFFSTTVDGNIKNSRVYILEKEEEKETD